MENSTFLGAPLLFSLRSPRPRSSGTSVATVSPIRLWSQLDPNYVSGIRRIILWKGYWLTLIFCKQFYKQKFQDDAIKAIIKRAGNAREVFFKFEPSEQITEIIEMLPECLEHLPYMEVKKLETVQRKIPPTQIT